MKRNEGSLLKYVTQGGNQNEIPPRSDDALNQTTGSEISVNVKDVNRDDDKLQITQSESKVHQNPNSKSTHEYDSDVVEDNSNLSSPTSDDKDQYEAYNTIRHDKTEPQQVDLTDEGLRPEIINNDTHMILVQQGCFIVQHLK